MAHRTSKVPKGQKALKGCQYLILIVTIISLLSLARAMARRSIATNLRPLPLFAWRGSGR